MYKLGICTFAVLVALLAGAVGNSSAQSPAELLAVERALRVAVNAHDVEKIASYFTDDAVMDYAVFGATPFVGKQQVVAFFGALFQAFPDFNDAEQRAFASDIVVTECLVTETHQGVWAGVAGTGLPVQDRHLTVTEFEGYKIKKMTAYDDLAGFLVQVGAMPASSLPPLVPSFTMPDPVKTSLTPIDAMDAILALWNSHDASGWAAMHSQDGDYFYNTLGVPLDRAQLVALQELYFQAFPDTRGEARVVDMGDGWSVSEYVFTGTNTGPFFGVPATGRSVTIRGASVNRWVDGQMAYFHYYMDNLTMFSRLGLIPDTGTPSAVQPSTWGRIKSTFR